MTTFFFGQVYSDYDPLTSDYCGAIDFNLPGGPFFASGTQEIKARSMICAVLTALGSRGWQLVTTIAMTRTIQDLSVFLFARMPEPKIVPYACISMSSTDFLQLVGFPPSDMETLR